MPEAIATTKRKFYKALDALTSYTPASVSTDISHSANTKRPATAALAFDEARNRARKRLRHSNSSSSLTSVNANTSTASLPHRFPGHTYASPSDSSGPGLQEPPHFSPWSHESFLARLKTFSSVSQWHPKPDAIGEVEWAKRGWVCVQVNTVACKGGCEKRLVVSLKPSKSGHLAAHEAVNGATDATLSDDPAKDNEDDNSTDGVEAGLVERYKAMIVGSHTKTCLWYKVGCKDDIYRLPVVRPSVWQPELRKRFHSVLAISPAIEKLKMEPSESISSAFPGPDRLLKELPKDILGPYNSAQSISERALSIAMHGWHGSSISGNQLLHCDACFQRVGLWMYQRDYKPIRLNSQDSPVAVEDLTPGDQLMRLDLVELHRDHCPWRNPDTQKATGSLLGLNACQILQRVAATCARDHHRRSNERSAPQGLESTEDDEDEVAAHDRPTFSKDEVARQDKERENRLQKLKNLFTIKRRTKA